MVVVSIHENRSPSSYSNQSLPSVKNKSHRTPMKLGVQIALIETSNFCFDSFPKTRKFSTNLWFFDFSPLKNRRRANFGADFLEKNASIHNFFFFFSQLGMHDCGCLEYRPNLLMVLRTFLSSENASDGLVWQVRKSNAARLKGPVMWVSRITIDNLWLVGKSDHETHTNDSSVQVLGWFSWTPTRRHVETETYSSKLCLLWHLHAFLW